MSEVRLLKEKLALLEKKQQMVEGLPHLYAHKFYKWQRDFFENTNKNCFLTAANQVGKAEEYQTLIPTEVGIKQMKDVKIGDYVFSKEGKKTKVIDIPWEGEDLFYKITFDDGSETISSQNHLWIAKDEKRRFRKKYTSNGKTWDNEVYGKWGVFSTKEILAIGKYNPDAIPRRRFSIPLCQPVEYSAKELSIKPYVLGAILGDGCITISNSSITTDLDIICEISGTENLSKVIKHKGCYTANILDIKTRLVHLGLYGAKSDTKFIPEIYKLGSVKQRKELLAGLLDTDGYVMGYKDKASPVEYCTTSETLKNDIIELVNSLGGVTNCVIYKESPHYKNKAGEKVHCKPCWRIYIKTQFNPFKLERKAKKWKQVNKYKHERIIYDIEPLGIKKGKCISVDNKEGSYLSSRNYIVTHNSTSNIIKCIIWATSPDMWPKLWSSQWHALKTDKVRLFWYMYPDSSTATIEFETKWSKYMPNGLYKDHPIYGWKSNYENKKIESINFNSGAKVVFKFYSQKAANIQSNSAYAVFVDEEIPFELYPEVKSRLSATEGYYNMVFTATLGQEEWRCAMEEKGDKETFKDAFKRQVSLYDCMEYEDGTPSGWSELRINRVKNSYPTESAIQARVYGKFAIAEGRVYESFEPARNVITPVDIGKDYYIYAGIDIGSGGVNHPSAITLTAVRNDFRKGYVFRGWLGNKVATTNQDIVEKYLELTKGLNVVAAYYDWHAKDFGMIALGVIPGLQKAEKSHDIGEGVLNVLFKNSKLSIFNTPELQALVNQLLYFKVGTLKTRANDDFLDSLRYSVSSIPWNYDDIREDVTIKVDKKTIILSDSEKRREHFFGANNQAQKDIERELEEWNELY